jgi:hypothetical protein
MAVQSNSDSSLMQSEAISTSSDGQFRTPETQIRKVIYEDELCRVHGVFETDGRFFFHSELTSPEKPSSIKHFKEVLKGIEESLEARGFEAIYTMADSPEGYRYNELFGFKSNLEVWTIGDDKFEVMVKGLH